MNGNEKKYGEIWLSNHHNTKPLRYEILPNGCYKVVGRKLNRRGVCTIGVNGVYKYAHRAVWEHFNGDIPEGLYILHSCDFGGCVNIEHMRLGTQADNARDREERGRTRGKVNNIETVEPDLAITINRGSSRRNILEIKINRENRCWEVANRVPLPSGYYKVLYKGKQTLAHRVMYELFNGTIPDGYVVRHKCNNPACVAPHHLIKGTQAENMEDKAKSGRQPRKLTDLQVTFIRLVLPAIRSRGNKNAFITQTEIGDWFGVAHSLINEVITGKRWKHIPSHEKLKQIWQELNENDNGTA